MAEGERCGWRGTCMTRGGCVAGERTAGKRAVRILLECCLANI